MQPSILVWILGCICANQVQVTRKKSQFELFSKEFEQNGWTEYRYVIRLRTSDAAMVVMVVIVVNAVIVATSFLAVQGLG